MNIHYRWRKLSCLAATTSVAALGLGSLASLPAAQAAEEVSIAQVQGTTDVSPLASRSVTTTGIVTAVYAEGGLNGYFIQTPGSSSADFTPGESDGIFVFEPVDSRNSVLARALNPFAMFCLRMPPPARHSKAC